MGIPPRDEQCRAERASLHPHPTLLRQHRGFQSIHIPADFRVSERSLPFCSCETNASRFARDKGLPFSNWFSKVDARKQIPHNSILFTCLFTFLLSLINIGSYTAWGALVSLNISSLMITYIVAYVSVEWRAYHSNISRLTRFRTASGASFGGVCTDQRHFQ